MAWESSSSLAPASQPTKCVERTIVTLHLNGIALSNTQNQCSRVRTGQDLLLKMRL